MFIKLTHYGNPIIFNTDKIVSFRLDADNKGNTLTKLFLVSGAHTFVDEGIIVLHKLLNNPSTHLTYDYDVPTIPDRMENQYNRDMVSPTAMEFDRPKRVRQYSSRPRYNEYETDRW